MTRILDNYIVILFTKHHNLKIQFFTTDVALLSFEDMNFSLQGLLAFGVKIRWFEIYVEVTGHFVFTVDVERVGKLINENWILEIGVEDGAAILLVRYEIIYQPILSTFINLLLRPKPSFWCNFSFRWNTCPLVDDFSFLESFILIINWKQTDRS